MGLAGALNDKCNFTHKMLHLFQLSHTGHTKTHTHNHTTTHLPCSECQQIVQLHVEWWYQQQYNRQPKWKKHLLAFSFLTAAVSLQSAANESTKFLVAMTEEHSGTHLCHLTTAASTQVDQSALSRLPSNWPFFTQVWESRHAIEFLSMPGCVEKSFHLAAIDQLQFQVAPLHLDCLDCLFKDKNLLKISHEIVI